MNLVLVAGLITMSAQAPPAAALPGDVTTIGTQEPLQDPNTVLVRENGHLVVADSGRDQVLDIDPATGTVTVVAGTGIAGFSGDGGQAADAQLDGPSGLALDASGDLYIADGANGRLRKVAGATGTGTIDTVAGSGVTTCCTEGAALAANIGRPYGIALDSYGNIQMSNFSPPRLLQFNPALNQVIVHPFIGNPPAGVVASADGFVYLQQRASNPTRTELWILHPPTENVFFLGGIGTESEGRLADVRLHVGQALALNSFGDLFLASNHQIRAIRHQEDWVSNVAGTTASGLVDGPAGSPDVRFNQPASLAFAPNGDLYVADQANDVIRRIEAPSRPPAPEISSDPDGPAQVAAGTRLPYSVTVSNDGTLPLTDVGVSADGCPTDTVDLSVNEQTAFDCVTLTTTAEAGTTRTLDITTDSTETDPLADSLEVDVVAIGPHGFADVPGGAWYDEQLDWASFLAIVSGFPDNTYRPKDPVNRAQIVSMLWNMADQPPGAPPNNFSDVPDGAWYEPALDWALDDDIITGFPDGTYRPKDPVNRAQLSMMLWNLAGAPQGAPPHSYPDVPGGAGFWYANGINWVDQHDILTGYPDGTYRPKDPVNRAQIVNALHTLANTPDAWANPDEAPTTVFF